MAIIHPERSRGLKVDTGVNAGTDLADDGRRDRVERMTCLLN